MLDGMSNSPPSSMFYRPRLGQAAAENLFIVCRCGLCRRQRVYLASDLVQVYHPEIYLDDLFGGRCPKCGKSDYWRVKQRYPISDDVGTTVVRRLAGFKRTNLWRDELYSAALQPEE